MDQKKKEDVLSILTAVGKTADAQMDLNTPAKDEKVYEGEDYGDN